MKTNTYPSFVPLTLHQHPCTTNAPAHGMRYNSQCYVFGARFDRFLISSRMSSARQAVHLADSFTGFGKRPAFTPSHQQVLPRGITVNT